MEKLHHDWKEAKRQQPAKQLTCFQVRAGWLMSAAAARTTDSSICCALGTLRELRRARRRGCPTAQCNAHAMRALAASSRLVLQN
eukprot:715768-Pleurochrysis_carterae.AAC.1